MKFKVIFLSVIAIMMTACGKQGSRGTTRMNRNTPAITGVMGSPSCQADTWGTVSNNQTTELDYRVEVANFLSEDLDAIGSVSPFPNSNGTGVDVRMTVTFSNGQFNPQLSQAAFRVRDSYVGQPSVDGSAVKPIDFWIQGQQGQGANGQFNVIFSDSKGTIRIEGYRTSANAQSAIVGRVFYTNVGQGERFLGNFQYNGCGLVGI